MPPKLTPSEERLLAAYREAALRLTRALGDAKAINNPRTAKRAVVAIVADLEALTRTYLTKELPKQFKRGSEEAVTALKRIQDDVDEAYGPVHKEALKQLVDDAALKFASALEGVRREASSLI